MVCYNTLLFKGQLEAHGRMQEEIQMKAIFFDFDGVLNSNKFICNNPGETVDRKNVKNLADVVKATDAKLVAIFNWRKEVMKDPVCDERAQELILKLKEEGLVISDVTPPQEHISGKYEDYGRCFEVKDYVDQHDVDRLVILDDMDSDWDRVGLADYWINTENTVKGFSESDAREVINILNS